MQARHTVRVFVKTPTISLHRVSGCCRHGDGLKSGRRWQRVLISSSLFACVRQLRRLAVAASFGADRDSRRIMSIVMPTPAVLETFESPTRTPFVIEHVNEE